jgi:hypothetical protein
VVLEVILSHLLHRAFAHYSEFYPEQRITYPCSVQPVKDAVRGMQIAWYEGSSHPIPENRRADIFAAVTANLNLAAEFDLTMEQLFRAKLLRLGGRTLAEEDKIGQTRAIEAAVNFLGTETGILPRPVTQLVAQYVDVPRAFDPNLNDERRLAIYRMCQPDFSDPRFISPAFRAVYFDLKKIENEIAEERAKEEAKRLREIEEQKARERKLAEDGAKKPEASELVETRFHSEDETTVAMPNPDPAPQSGGQVAQKSKGGEGRGGVDQKD